MQHASMEKTWEPVELFVGLEVALEFKECWENENFGGHSYFSCTPHWENESFGGHSYFLAVPPILDFAVPP